MDTVNAIDTGSGVGMQWSECIYAVDAVGDPHNDLSPSSGTVDAVTVGAVDAVDTGMQLTQWVGTVQWMQWTQGTQWLQFMEWMQWML